MHTDTKTAGSEQAGHAAIISPIKLAHVVLRTSRYRAMTEWYETVLGAKPAFANDILTFLSYDEEHHRIAIVNMPGLADQKEGVAGVHHVAFTFGSLPNLAESYARLRDQNITPIYVINHGPTTSMYYADPDGNQIELQVDNYDTIEEATAFFYSPAFAENPIGVELDPEDLLKRLAAGESEERLKQRPDIGKRGLADVKLR